MHGNTTGIGRGMFVFNTGYQNTASGDEAL
jgi:hypothetical protein